MVAFAKCGGSLLALMCLVSSGACQVAQPADDAPPKTLAAQQPWKAEVRLGKTGGFDAYLVHSADVGVWTVKSANFLKRYGCPEIIALDDRGRCTVLVSYSGKWTPWTVVQDGQWLGGIALADVDPRRAGEELYVGGKNGNLYQIHPHPNGAFDSNMIAYFPGREIHTLVAGDLDVQLPGSELLVFTRPGGLYLLKPGSQPGVPFESSLIEELGGRVRDAVILPAEDGSSPELITVGRTGEMHSLHMNGGKPVWTLLFKAEMGLGRVAQKPVRNGDPVVLYVTADDGCIFRLKRAAGGDFIHELIYTGHPGPRGIAAGQFDKDPEKETVAIFGYSRRVELVTREADGWCAQTIFEDIDKGHWISSAEVDGRNATRELVLSGYGGRVVLLTRPPGYGLH